MRLKVCIMMSGVFAAGLLIAAESTPEKKPGTPVKSPSSARAAAPVAKSAAPTQAAFDAAVKPLFDSTCSMCHSAGVASGGLNIDQYAGVDSLSTGRDE